MSNRLEAIKNRRKNYNPDVLPIWWEDMDWLIEQAERVEELEKSLNLLGCSTQEIIHHSEAKDEVINNLEQQNKRYREEIENMEIVKKYRNEAHKFFSNLSDEDFFSLLEDAGFELEQGEGKVIFADN